MKSLGVTISLIVLFTVIAGWLRFANLGLVNLHDDEFLQFETAVNLNRNGTWERFDYYTEQPGKAYHRAAIYIKQIQLSLGLFGETEFAARLPAVIWGTLLIPVVMLTLLATLQHRWIVYATGFVLIFDNLSIFLSRYVRMYSMLMVLAVLMTFSIYMMLEAKWRWQRIVAALAGLGTVILGILIFRELTLAVLGAIGVYVVIRTISFAITKHPSDLPWVWLGIGGALIVCTAVIFTLSGVGIIPLDAVIIRRSPHWSYFMELFLNWRVMVIAGLFFITGIILALKQFRSYLGLNAVIACVVLIYFAFFSHRWDAQRYISVATPAILLITAVGWIATLRFLFALLPEWKLLRYSLIVPLAVLTGPWLSWPGVPTWSIWNQVAYADETTTDLGYADMKTAYAYVAQQVQAGEVVLMQGPRYYYWPDQTIPIYKLGGYKSLSLNDFKDLQQLSQVGVWVVYNADHARHLRDDVKKYVSKHGELHTELQSTNVLIYRLEPKK